MATKKIAKLLIEIGIVTKGATREFDKVNRKMGKLGSSSGAMSKLVTRGLMAVGASAVAGLGISIKKAMEFNQEMKRVQAITQATDADFKKMNETALQLSNKMGIASHDVAEGMKEMAKFGFDANKIIGAMPHVMNATIASGERFGTVLKVTEALLSEFGLGVESTEKVVDTLTKTSFETRANISKLGEAFKFSAPVAKQLGISMEELAAATGLMINAGVEGGLAGRSLRKSMLSLAGPTKKAEEKLEELGIQVTENNGKMKPLKDIIEQLSIATKDMGNAEKVAALKTIFGIEAVSGMLALIEKGPKALGDLTKKIEESGGITEETANKMNDTLVGSLNKLRERVTNLAIHIGTYFEPALKAMVDSINELFDGVSFEDIQAKFMDFKNSLMEFLGESGILGTAQERFDRLKEMFSKAWDEIYDKFKEKLDKIKAWWDKHGASITLAINKVLMEIQEIWNEVWDDIEAVVDAVWPVINDIIDMALDTILTLIAVFADIINGDWEKLWDDVYSFVGRRLDATAKLITDIFAGMAKMAIHWGGKLLGGFIDGIKSKVKALKDTVNSVANTVKNFLGISSPSKLGPLSTSDKWMPNLMDMFQDGIEMGIPKVRSAVMDVATTISGVNSASEGTRNVTSTNNVNIYPQQTNLNSKQLMRELNRVAWMQGGML